MKQWMTFGIKTEGAEKAKGDIDGVAAATKKAEESQEGLNDSIESGTGALDKMTGGAIGAFKGVVGGVKKAVMGMRTLKGAMMATGIGAIVVLVASLMMYFTKTKKGAEVLQVAMAGLGAVFGVMTDVLSSIGETMVWAFNSPQEAVQAVSDKMEALGGWFSDLGNYLREVFLFSMLKIKRSFYSLAAASKEFLGFDASDMRAEIRSIDAQLNESVERMEVASDKVTAPLKDAWDNVVEGVTNFIETVVTAVKSATALEKRAVALADAQRNLSVEFAQTRAKMVELKKASEDVNNTIEDRIKATEEAGALELELASKSLALAQEAVNIKREQNNLSESTAEDLQALADLEIALSNAQIETAGVQTELLVKVNSLYAEQKAKIAEATAQEEQRITDIIARQAEVDDIIDAGQARELQKIKDFWIAKRAEAALEQQILVGDKEAEEMQLQAITDKYQKIADDKVLAAAAELKAGKIAALKATLDGLASLNEMFNSLSASEMEGNAAREAAIQEETDAAKKYQLQKANYEILKQQDEQGRKGFENSKKLQIAQALIQTYQSATAAFSSLAGIPVIGPVLGGIAAAAAVAGGFAQIAAIKKTTYESSAVAPVAPTSSGGGGGGAAAAAAANGNDSPQLDLGFLGEGAGGSIQAYVISEQVTNQQQADQIVTDQTTL